MKERDTIEIIAELLTKNKYIKKYRLMGIDDVLVFEWVDGTYGMIIASAAQSSKMYLKETVLRNTTEEEEDNNIFDLGSSDED